MKIGIPRALFWYYNPDAYRVFWEALGFEVVQSPPTNRQIFEEGLRLAHDELCMPVKILHGHVAFLKEKVDFIFIPRIVKMMKGGKKRYACPKFIGLPELIRNSIPSLLPLITVDIDLIRYSLEGAFLRLGERFNLKKGSIRKAVREMIAFERRRRLDCKPQGKKNGLKLGVIGHPYILYDPYLSLGLLDKISSLGVEYTTSAEVSEEEIEEELRPEIDVYWRYERELIGAVSYFLRSGKFDGSIYCLSFGCGPGSIITEIIQRKVVKDGGFPLLTLVLDEGTGEAGLVTRLEAFYEIVRAKRR